MGKSRLLVNIIISDQIMSMAKQVNAGQNVKRRKPVFDVLYSASGLDIINFKA